MKTLLSFFALLALILLIPRPAFASDPAGLWLTENQRAVIRIDHCQQSLCGRVFWIIPGGMQQDSKNPDASQRNHAMCGLPILWGFQQQDDNNWIDGTIYKADDGDIYHAVLQTLPSGQLLVRGYVGMPLFGQSQTWTRVDADKYPSCAGRSAFMHQHTK
jgi:uncharacterized protein (DUF2147 family)